MVMVASPRVLSVRGMMTPTWGWAAGVVSPAFSNEFTVVFLDEVALANYGDLAGWKVMVKPFLDCRAPGLRFHCLATRQRNRTVLKSNASSTIHKVCWRSIVNALL